MDGPPPDPRMLPIDASWSADPTGHLICVAVAILAAVAARRSPSPARQRIWLGVAVVVGFTSPWLAWVDRAWFGDFPTIDKEGSLLFFLDGVHQRLYLAPLDAAQDAAVRLIGVHAGHLWVTELLATVLSPMGAFNAQGLLQLALGWAAAAWAIHEVVWGGGRPLVRSDSTAPWAAWVAGFPFGMGLHVFRDLNWTTIEKGGVAFLAAFVGLWSRAARQGGRWVVGLAACYGAMALYNLYFAVVGAGFGALYVGLRWAQLDRAARLRLVAAAGACCAVGVPVALAQLAIQAGGPSLASPERFLWERAALDGFSLVPLHWNRLEVWRACNPVMVGLSGVGAWTLRHDRRVWAAAGVALGLFVVAWGPVLLPGEAVDAPRLANPVYMGLHAWIPGFWRLAKPEVFFQPVWLMVLGAGAVGLHHVLRHRRAVGLALAVLVFAVWWPLVRLHAAFPGLSAPVHSDLSPQWQDKVFRGAEPPP